VPLSTAGWARVDEASGYEPGMLWLGRTEGRQPFGHYDAKHVCIVAGSRSGKGRSFIIPNLCEWPGSVICIDPKGENAYHTARGRAERFARQRVVVLDPFGIGDLADMPSGLKGTFNPLDLIDAEREDAVDEAALLADALIVDEQRGGEHWTLSARNVLRALIYYTCKTAPPEQRSLLGVRRLLTSPNLGDPDSKLTAGMRRCGGIAAEAADTLCSKPPNERSSILSTAIEQTAFLSSPAMAGSLATTNFNLNDLKLSPGGLALYLCIPARRLATHARWLRLVIALALARMEAIGRRAPACGHDVLFILEEMATLGHMREIDQAAGLMAGYGVKLISVLQDLTQLQRNYRESWETFLGNAGTLIFFGNTDLTTLEHISKRLGRVQIVQSTTTTAETAASGTSNMPELAQLAAQGTGFEVLFRSFADTRGYSESRSVTENESRGVTQTELLSPEEVRRHFAADANWMLVFLDGERPIGLRRTNYDEDPFFAGKFTP
jgi:type IV secretion system protein VirD4